MHTTSPSDTADRLDGANSGASSYAPADRSKAKAAKSSAGADKSPVPPPPAIIDLAKLLARLAASEIVLGDDLAKRVLDGTPNSSDPQAHDR